MNKIIITIVLLIMISGCNSKKNIRLEDNFLKKFSIERYLGKWDEVARTDNKFERGLTDVTAEYIIEKNNIIVINKGWDENKQIWKTSKGYIKETSQLGRLKVSFFRPFYGSYNILYIDKDYKYALVGGNKSEYLWILKRRKEQMPKKLLDEYLDIAKKLGYDTKGMIFKK